jgi:hypothetical protein
MKTYQGVRMADGTAIVRVAEKLAEDAVVLRSLALRLDLANHSPTGFEWGYGGSGPAQLAVAILADVLADDALAVRLHQDFKWAAIAPLERSAPWVMTEDDVRSIVGLIAESDRWGLRPRKKPTVLMRQPDGEVVRICGDCGEYLVEAGLLIHDELQILQMAPGVTFDQVRTAAMAHHGPHAPLPHTPPSGGEGS